MARPIFIMHVYKDTNKEKITTMLNLLKKELEEDYHVLVLNDLYAAPTHFECFNDCKGLPDIDIEALINKLV